MKWIYISHHYNQKPKKLKTLSIWVGEVALTSYRILNFHLQVKKNHYSIQWLLKKLQQRDQRKK